MKRVLLISRSFAPCIYVGGHRAVKLARRLGDFGWEPIILTVARGCQEPLDPTFGRDVLERCQVVRVPCWSLWQHSHNWRSATPWVKRILLRSVGGLHYSFHRFFPFDYAYFWMRAAIEPGVSLVRRLGIDLIWASSPPFSSCILAHAIARRTGLPYVVDFRDSPAEWDGQCSRGVHRRLRQVERVVVGDAAAVTYVSPAQYEVLLRRFPMLESKTRQLLYNWFETGEVERYPAREFDRPTILHGGVLYGGRRRLDGFLEGLRMLRDSGRVVDLQFVQHSVESVEFLHRVAEKHGVADAVRTGPALPRPEFLSACRGASILLLAVGHDSRGQQHAGAIPGKLYDYMAAGRPILVVGPRDCEAGRLVREHDLGMSVADDDAAGIAGAIESLLGLCPSEGGNGSRRSKVELFEANHVVRSFANLFNELCCGGPGGSMPESTLAHISPIEDAHRERAPHARMSEQG